LANRRVDARSSVTVKPSAVRSGVASFTTASLIACASESAISACSSTGGRPVGVRSIGIDAMFLPLTIYLQSVLGLPGMRNATIVWSELPPTIAFRPLTAPVSGLQRPDGTSHPRS
jgi:hypothetical protein